MKHAQILIHVLAININCRDCHGEFEIEGHFNEDCSGLDVELLAHETLDEHGWSDGRCPVCLEVAFSSRDDDSYNNSVELL